MILVTPHTPPPLPKTSAPKLSYPLDARFKFFALSQTIHIRAQNGELAFCVKQKAFKLKEDIRVFSDEAQTRPLFTIKADRIIDWSASYTATTDAGEPVCTVRRKGGRSLWRATYEVFIGERLGCTITEKNPWSKVWDSLISQIPIVGILSCFLFHPVYAVLTPNGEEIMSATKQASLLEGKFGITAGPALTGELEYPAITGIFMTLLLERRRG